MRKRATGEPRGACETMGVLRSFDCAREVRIPVPNNWQAAIVLTTSPITTPSPVMDPPKVGRCVRRAWDASGQGLLRGPPLRAPPYPLTLGAPQQGATQRNTRNCKRNSADQKR